MTKVISEAKHDGICGHCKTRVPLDASVCASCGAHWGTSTGQTLTSIYAESKARIITGSITCLLLALFFAGTVYFESPWIILSTILGLLVGVPAIAWVIGGAISMMRINKIAITWWRNT